MSARWDEEFALRYEQDKAWYEENYGVEARAEQPPTRRQLHTIKKIEECPWKPKFTGTTRREASEYISRHNWWKEK